MAAPKKTPISAEDIHTILGPESSFEGKLVFNGGQVRIEGHFKGEVKTESTLIIGESARVEANVDVGNVVVTGEVIGDITARGSVGIERPGKVKGTIVTPSLMIEEGVIFEGTCRMEQAVEGNVPANVARLVSNDVKKDPPPGGNEL